MHKRDRKHNASKERTERGVKKIIVLDIRTEDDVCANKKNEKSPKLDIKRKKRNQHVLLYPFHSSINPSINRSMLLLPELGNDPLRAETQLLHLIAAALAARLPHTEEVVQQCGGGNVEEDVHPHEAEVPPSLRPVDVGAVEILVRNAESAVAAVAGRKRVLERAGSCGQVGREVLLAGLADVGRAEGADFCGGAFDRSAVQHCCGYAGYPVGEGRDAVHEDPEAGEGAGALHDTTEL
jgi:hypothetical protein